MKVSGINAPARLSFTANNSSKNNIKKKSSLNFCGNESTKVGAAILVAATLIGFLIYLGLAPQAKKTAVKDADAFQKQTKTPSFSKNPKKDVTVNRPSNKHYQAALEKQKSLQSA